MTEEQLNTNALVITAVKRLREASEAMEIARKAWLDGDAARWVTAMALACNNIDIFAACIQQANFTDLENKLNALQLPARGNFGGLIQ